MTPSRIRFIRAAHKRYLKKIAPKKPRGPKPKVNSEDFQAFSKQHEAELLDANVPSDKDVIGEVLSNG
jgi:hypothetical protein